MKVSCELMGSRAMCAKAYLKRDLFSDYRLNVQMLRAGGMDPNQPHQQGQDYTCHLSLNSLIDSLMILGSGQKDTSKDLQSCVLHLEIQAQNHPLIVTSVTIRHRETRRTASVECLKKEHQHDHNNLCSLMLLPLFSLSQSRWRHRRRSSQRDNG